MQPHVGVFVSSTSLDLVAERDAVAKAINRMRATKFIGMEDFGSRDETTRAVSLDEVDRCDVYVGIFAGRWGSGITEDEYRRARERSLKCFIYFKRDTSPGGMPADADQTSKDRLASLKTELSRDHTVSHFSDPKDLAGSVTADLYRWLFDEYLSGTLNTLLDRQSDPSELREVLAAVRNVADLGKELVARLEATGRISLQLRGAYLNPASVFERVNLDQFVGREWLIAYIEEFIASHDRGYFVIEADAGLGKTAVLAHYVQQRSCVYHFSELAPGTEGIGPTLRSLAAQLVGAWQIEPEEIDPILRDPTRSDLLQALLGKAAAQRDRLKPGEPIVVVVDALDEAGTPLGQNVLGLPRTLPAGVYFIVSERPIKVRLIVDVPRQICSIDAQGKGNRDDQERFLRKVLASRSRDTGEDVSTWVEQLLARSDGNWVYLHYVVSEIEQGHRTLRGLDKLPHGVWQFYAQFWETWRADHATEWNEGHRQLLTCLAAIRQDAACDLLARFSGMEPVRIRELLEEHWRPFVAVTRGDTVRYRPYHASLRQFLEGEVTLERLTSQESSFALSLAEETRLTHSRIADRYLDAWGGLDGNLDRLTDANTRDLDGRYGLRNAVHHLQKAGRDDHLHAMLAVEWKRENAWFAVHEQIGDLTGYLTDIAIAWERASEKAIQDLEASRPAAGIALEVRYALITASVNTVASRLPTELAMALADAGIWTVAYGLSLARQIVDTSERAVALARWVERLPPDLQAGVSREAFSAAQGVKDPSERCAVLTAVASAVRGEVRSAVVSAALRTAAGVDALADWQHVIRGVAALLDERLLEEATELAAGAAAPEDRSPTTALARLSRLAAILECTPAERSGRVAASADELASEIKQGLDASAEPALDYTLIARFLSGAARVQAIARANEAIARLQLEIEESEYTADIYADELVGALIPLAKALDGDERTTSLRRVIRIIMAGHYPRSTAKLFLVVLPELDKPLCVEFVDELLRKWKQLFFPFDLSGVCPVAARCAELGLVDTAMTLLKRLGRIDQARVLTVIAGRLDERQLRRAQRIVFARDSRILRWIHRRTRTDIAQYGLELAAAFVPRLAQLGHTDEAMSILGRFGATKHDEWKSMVADTAAHLPADALRLLLLRARRINDADARFLLASRECRYLPEDAVRRMLIASREVRDPSTRRKSVSLLCGRLAELGQGDTALKTCRRLFSDNPHHLYESFSPTARYLPRPVVDGLVHDARPRFDALNQASLTADLIPFASPAYLADWSDDVVQLLTKHGEREPDAGAAVLAAQLAPYVEEPRGSLLRRALLESGVIKTLGSDLRGTVHRGLLSNAQPEMATALEQQVLESAVEFAGERERKYLVRYLRKVLLHVSEEAQKTLVERAIAARGEGILAELAGSLPESAVDRAMHVLASADPVARRYGAQRLADIGRVDVSLEMAEGIEDDPVRAAALVGVAQAILGRASPLELYEVWSRFLPILARQERPRLLDMLGSAVDIMAALGGEAAARETVTAIDASGRWWP